MRHERVGYVRTDKKSVHLFVGIDVLLLHPRMSVLVLRRSLYNNSVGGVSNSEVDVVGPLALQFPMYRTNNTIF